MPKYKEVELLSVGKVRVYLPPNMKIHAMMQKRHPLPPQPTMKVPLVTPKDEPKQYETLLIAKGPEFDAWEAECDGVRETIATEEDEQFYLFALKDVKVPDAFDIEAEYGELIRYKNETWEPRTGKIGRKLDYLEWVVMGYSDDMVAVTRALDELTGISQEVVDDVKATFPGDVEGSSAGGVDRDRQTAESGDRIEVDTDD